MIVYYIGLTALISWWISSGTFWTITSLITYYSGYQGDYHPVGFIVLNTIVVISIAFLISHLIIRSLVASNSIQSKLSYIIAISISSLLAIIPTALSAYKLAYREYDIFLTDSLQIIANFGALAIAYLIVRQLFGYSYPK